jgi:hypothetical protein
VFQEVPQGSSGEAKMNVLPLPAYKSVRFNILDGPREGLGERATRRRCPLTNSCEGSQVADTGDVLIGCWVCRRFWKRSGSGAVHTGQMVPFQTTERLASCHSETLIPAVRMVRSPLDEPDTRRQESLEVRTTVDETTYCPDGKVIFWH